jgi:hypothetical protein
MTATAPQKLRDSASQLRSATRRAKSDVANKLISMFLHELSRSISRGWSIKLGSLEYETLVRECFGNRCPYCNGFLNESNQIIEHLDGMNRYRAGLHVPGNVLVACKRCNSEKRRDDSLKVLTLADSGWASFLSHDGTNCPPLCRTCKYWEVIWEEESDRKKALNKNSMRLTDFRQGFPEFQSVLHKDSKALPALLTKLYGDCQVFAETEIKLLLDKFSQESDINL